MTTVLTETAFNMKKRIKVRGCLSLCAIFVVLVTIACMADTENWCKTNFIIYVESNYLEVYQKRYGRLPTSLDGLDGFINMYAAKPLGEEDALALYTYHRYHPVMTHVEVSADGKQIKALVRFDGFWVHERDVVITSIY